MKYKGKQHANWTNHWLWVLCSWFLCSSNPCPSQKKTNNLWMLSATYKCLSIFSHQLYWVSCVKLESFWLVAIFQTCVLNLFPANTCKYVGTLFFGSRCSFFPCFMDSNWICLPEGDHKDYHNWVSNGLFGTWERAPFYETGALLMKVCFIPPQNDCFVGVNDHV